MPETALEALADDLRRIHNPGDDGVLAPGTWCIADGDDWPCRTMRAVAQHMTRTDHPDETDTTSQEAPNA